MRRYYGNREPLQILRRQEECNGHSTCEEYIEWREELDELNAVIREYVMIDMCAYYRRQRAIDYCRRRGEKIYK